MRLVNYVHEIARGVGRLDGERLIPLLPGWLTAAELTEAGLTNLANLASGATTPELDRALQLDAVRLGPAIPRPGKVVGIGLNYRDHVEEQHRPIPDRPTLFAKFANAVIATGEPILRPAGTTSLDLEVELGVVIGRRASRIDRRQATACIAGYVVANDVTARNWQGNQAALAPDERGDGQWLRAKGSDTFLPLGPVFTTADEVSDPHRLPLRSWRIPGSGPDAGRPVPMQDGTTASMLVEIPALIEFVSASITLEPGDLLLTGTPAGVGVFRNPPIFLVPGDRAVCEIDGLGRVDNPVVDAATGGPKTSDATIAQETA